MTIGDAIKKVRKELGMTQIQFCVDVGIAHGTLTKYERGEQAPAWGMILKIIDTCGVDWLIELLEEMR